MAATRRTPRPSARKTRSSPARRRSGRKSRRDAAPLVIGLTGPNASGKGEVAKFLASLGFSVHSLSDVVRDEATRLGLAHTRDHLIRIGVRLRSAGGPGALARRVLPRLEPRSVVDSIRNPGEVVVLRGLRRFLLLGVDAPQPLRFERSLRRGRPGDGMTLQEFARKEARENSDSDAGQQLLATLALADEVIDNDGTIEDLHERARRTLRRRGIRLGRPRSLRPGRPRGAPHAPRAGSRTGS